MVAVDVVVAAVAGAVDAVALSPSWKRTTAVVVAVVVAVEGAVDSAVVAVVVTQGRIRRKR